VIQKLLDLKTTTFDFVHQNQNPTVVFYQPFGSQHPQYIS